MKTYFELFDLPPRHSLDVAALDAKYRELSLKLHPDRIPDPKERLKAVDQTATLNQAHKTLRDPVQRAFYLLKLNGIDLEREDDKAHRDVPIEFLEEVMELREELDEARAAKDVDKANQMAQEVDDLKQRALDEAVASLNRLADQPADGDALKLAARELSRVRYFTRFLEEAEAIEEESL